MISTILFTALLSSASVSAHGVLIAVQGAAGSPQGQGFQVNNALARNCTGINPCQQDTTLIRDAEIAANIVNECGRTELNGNIDVGTETENQLAANMVTQVTAGSPVTVTIHQVNADGAGPYSCDIDEQSNGGILSQNLTVTNNVPGVNGLSQAAIEDFNITVSMPANLKCIGGSTGNICTVRCRNNAQAGPFGGCFPVQQTDTTANVNSPNTISTAQTLAGVNEQINENQVDLPIAIANNQVQGTDTQKNALAAANILAGVSVTSKASPTQTLARENIDGAAAATGTAAAAAAATTTAATSGGKKGSKGNTNGQGNTATGAKAGKNNNNKRESGLRWARRMLGSPSEN